MTVPRAVEPERPSGISLATERLNVVADSGVRARTVQPRTVLGVGEQRVDGRAELLAGRELARERDVAGLLPGDAADEGPVVGGTVTLEQLGDLGDHAEGVVEAPRLGAWDSWSGTWPWQAPSIPGGSQSAALRW